MGWAQEQRARDLIRDERSERKEVRRKATNCATAACPPAYAEIINFLPLYNEWSLLK
jgi:hypothetical protein